MKDKMPFVVFWILVAGAVGWWACGEIKESMHNSEIEKRRIAQEAQTSQRLQAAIQSYGAVATWGGES